MSAWCVSMSNSSWVTVMVSLFPHSLLLGFLLFPWWEIGTEIGASRLEEPPTRSSHLHFVVLVEQELSFSLYKADALLTVLLMRCNHGFSCHSSHWHIHRPMNCIRSCRAVKSTGSGGLPWWSSGEESALQCRVQGFNLWLRTKNMPQSS